MKEIDPNILKRAGLGDIAAFEEIYKTASGFVYNLALNITRNQSDAEEVTQDVFIKIYNKLKDFRFQSEFKTWLYRVTVNTAINYYKKSSKDKKNIINDENAIDTVPAENSTIEDIDKNSNVDNLKKLLETLPPEYKTCLILREIEGMSYEEIAGTLKIPLNTVRSRLKRARMCLLKKMGKEKIL
ncbi:RNA polymerase sigma factor SigE [Candidatus Omnitrophus magneticus]|uniref:RNA polymerase sigma factor n=1 Tax=Candidatus Omnitrophus magneticus TaxID=1609969 RepID=A0A0F0CU06_9BACT|nr:RNA polymerase sigma factor SigE [Candidatus Omnitrophus magneticus]